ncbi:MAG: Cof-type HAD-IIB family hydrolase [Parabacteroides sp.]|nr:Cof-type HAD-IIB family hydrolase [Parabacteroides sp.]
MKYKLLVLDVDGTLLNDAKEVSPHNIAAVRKAQQMGIQIVLASGRPTSGILPIANKLELNHYGGYVISYNGAQIINMQTGDVIFEKRLENDLLAYLDKKAKRNDFAIFTYKGNKLFTEQTDNSHIINEAQINNLEIVKINDFANIEFRPSKCVLTSDNTDELISLENHWKKRLAGMADVFRSEDYFLEVVPPTVDKGNTLALLIQELKLSTDEVVAIGDGVADVSMLQLAGTSIAMGNARDSVKACADFITLSNEENGVAAAIEKALLTSIKPTEIPLEQLNARGKHALMGNLGIQYTYVSDNRVEATMPVDERTRQPFGILHGGATLALAETVAGLGSMLIANPDEMVVGMQVSGNHMSSAHEGDTVRAVGSIIHKGRSSHVWDVNIYTSTDKLVSSVRVVNSILKKK